MFSLDLRHFFYFTYLLFYNVQSSIFAKMALHSLITCFSVAESPIFLLLSIHFIAKCLTSLCKPKIKLKYVIPNIVLFIFFISLRVYIIVNFSSSLFPCVRLWHIQTVKQYTILLSSFTRIEK
ncbi:unnamed protein product [Meloidogyne enterolobii]|uniref:Uncharacterized protein n=2 Tax=Meloidogyne enterolobii TaxID=390850 RepID=A0ACB1AUV0_MELEN|nr:unnamed protein product [Meloidogyne enterolobii]